VLVLIKNKRNKKYRKTIDELDREKNIIESTPVLLELAKVETIIKNDKMEEKYNQWQERFNNIKTDQIVKINDSIIELDMFIDNKDYEGYQRRLANVEIEISKAKTMMNTLLNEVKEINSSEEKYRSIVIKLKTKYRELSDIFETNKKEYEDIAEVIELQFENIEKRFQDFEESMEKNEYSEVVHIVKAIDNMVDHMSIVVTEVPDLVLLAEKLIPKRIEQITETYQDMISKEYPIGYMNIEYNVEEALKNVNAIIDRIKVLNLEDCMFELRTMLEYLDSMFNEFEKEKASRKEYEDEVEIFNKKLEKVNKVVSDIYGQLEEIKNLYDLTDEDLLIIDEVNNRLNEVNEEYKNSLIELQKKEISYSKLVKKLENLTLSLANVEDDLDSSLKSLGNMYEDEIRAREQLDEIQELLNQSKVRIRGYKLPIIGNEYFVQLTEANEAILEIIKELERKPISIRTLNTRVDTARDLVLKLYNTTNEMIKNARLVEDAIIYGNRFRKDNIEIDKGLSRAEVLFYKGNYKKALEVSFDTLDTFDPGIKVRLMHSYENERQ
jgi:septation ring formation regulator EzrA